MVNDIRIRKRLSVGSVMVWGGTTEDGKTDLVDIRGNMGAQVYRDIVLAPIVMSFIHRHRGHTVHQHDSACPFDNQVSYAQQCRRNDVAHAIG